MVQMFEVSERLLQNASNFMRVETDACIWGAGGVNEKLKQFSGLSIQDGLGLRFVMLWTMAWINRLLNTAQ